uniref:Uncharacterized protein n=1 Tax=Mus musculus TaxID=10090 RepID=Q3TYX6_MOUSE|nr:unnamed protein product [Mus musculus]
MNSMVPESLCSACPPSSTGQHGSQTSLCGIRPQYPEFFQEKEDGKDSEGESRCLTLGCLSVWKRPVLPDWLHVPQDPKEGYGHFKARE